MNMAGLFPALVQLRGLDAKGRRDNGNRTFIQSTGL